MGNQNSSYLESTQHLSNLYTAKKLAELDDRVAALEVHWAGGKTIPLCTSPPKEKGCAECGVKTSDGYALYCVKCSEPMREWVGLTADDISKAKTLLKDNDPEYAIFFIMARLQEYNT